MDLYGMSECSGPQTCALPSAYRAGFCGRALPGCELKLHHVPGRDPANEGEARARAEAHSMCSHDLHRNNEGQLEPLLFSSLAVVFLLYPNSDTAAAACTRLRRCATVGGT